MPVQQPPLPPVTPSNEVPVVINNQIPNTSAQDLLYQPSTQFEDNGTTTSNSNSTAENAIIQDASQSNYQINNNHNTYAKFKSGSQLPVPVWQTDFLYNPSTGDKVIKTGISVPLPGRSRTIIHREATLDNIARESSICSGILSKFTIDYEKLPQLSSCQGLTPIVATAPVIENNTSELDKLRQEMLEYKKLIKEQQQTIQAFQMRIIQMEHQAPVRVGG